MKYKFTKMQGCGNDYIYFDCFSQNSQDIVNPGTLARRLSDRHFGVGGDGIVLILPSDTAHAKMRMFNADGSEGEMCGNAIRCVAKFLYERGLCKKNPLSIETLAGIKTLSLTLCESVVQSVTVDMGSAILAPSEIPVNLPGTRVVAHPVNIGGVCYDITCVSMGNPHCVLFFDSPVKELDLQKIGPIFEKNAIFPQHINTEFAQVIDKNRIEMRVWERGSGETLACGTGACAVVVAAALRGFCEPGSDVTVKLPGGELLINYTEERVLMTGPAKFVFCGEVEVLDEA